MNRFIVQESYPNYPNFPGIVFQCHFDKHHFSDALEHFLEGELPQSIRDSVLKRRAEFVAGRYAAEKALRALGTESTFVGVGQNRMPIWPNAFNGSISHSAHRAFCAVTRDQSVTGVGIDIEAVIDASLTEEIISSVVRPEEVSLVETTKLKQIRFSKQSDYCIDVSPPFLVTLIFSAKESLFKALYPSVGYYFDFSAARMLSVDFQYGRFKMEVVEDLTEKFRMGYTVNGNFALSDENVVTYLYV